MSDFSNSTLGVTGASGHLGRAVIANLLARGAKRVVATTRDPAKLGDLASRIEVRAADFNDPASLPKAFDGIERLLIISTDDFNDRAGQQRRVIDAAEAAGVKHIGYTSITSPYPDPPSLASNTHFWTEARLISGGTNWSILRNNLYADYLLPTAQHAIATGHLFHAARSGRRAYVTRDDCAAAAAGALLTTDGRRIFDISGPEALSSDDLAALFAKLSGRPVVAQNLPAEALIASMKKGGVPDVLAGVLTRFDTDAAKGYLGIVTNAVEELTGRPAESVATFLARDQTALAA
jgi:NAD(P)H dehydrogenase (quinone)